MRVTNDQTLLFIGDSLTDCGRTGPFAPFGQGYVAILRAMLLSRHPQLRLRFINKGVNGDTIRDLAHRWREDVLDEKPEHLFILIGINDVWRSFSAPENQAFHVPQREFHTTYEDLIRVSRQAGIRSICACGCFFVEPRSDEPMRRMCEEYNQATKEAIEKSSLQYIDLQAEIDRLLEHQHPMAIASDRVHLNPHAHFAIAEKLYNFIALEKL